MTPAERARIREAARRSAEQAPPLKPEQRDRLAGLLRASTRKRVAS
jgi:hypothetical protein